jgi:hypothetical protein
MLRNFVQIVGVIEKMPSPYLAGGADTPHARSKLRINRQSAHVQLANIVAQEQGAAALLECSVGDVVYIEGHLSVSKSTGKLQILIASLQPYESYSDRVTCAHHMQIPQMGGQL